MQMTLNGYTHEPVLGSLDMIANANNTNIRLFTFKRVTSNKPIRDVKGKWLVSNSENTAVFSAIGYSFANYLNKVLDIPIGIINTSWGGTPAEAWTDNKTLVENFKKSEIKNFREGKPKNHDPSALFNGMINPLIPFKIRGALWYQGESNVSRANNYTKLMNVMIDGWRREWNQGSFPFYFVQIAPFKYSGSNKSESAYLREAQLKTMLQTKNSGMAVTLDIGKEFSIHPDKKIIIGKRLAYWALANDYKVKGVPFSGPVYKSIEINEDKAIVDFDYAESGFIFLNSKINGFEIAGEDKVFHPASVKVMYGNKNSTLTISSDKVKEPVAVRYGWKNYLKGNLYNTKGLPASSFRSDNW
jgi:sialate O-acetylesterase